MTRRGCCRIACGLAMGACALVAGCENDRAAATVPGQPAARFRSADVDSALAAADTVVQTRGFVPEWGARRGFLVERGSEVFETSLAVDACYVATAASSGALTDIDLRLYAADGSELTKDLGVGPTAALRYCPPHPGTHYLAVRAGGGAGLFGVALFRGPTGIDVRLDDLFRDSTSPPEPGPAERL